MTVGVVISIEDCLINFLGGDGVFKGTRLIGDRPGEVDCSEGERGCLRFETTSEKSLDGTGGDPHTEVEVEGCGVGDGKGGVFREAELVWTPDTPSSLCEAVPLDRLL